MWYFGWYLASVHWVVPLSFLFFYPQRLQNFPTNEKYLFLLEGVNNNDNYFTIQSVKNKKYLYCEENGNVSMKVAGKKMSNGVPEDRAMWFSFLDYQQQGHSDLIQEHKTYTKISLSLSV